MSSWCAHMLRLQGFACTAQASACSSMCWTGASCGCLWRSSGSSMTCHTLMAGQSVLGKGCAPSVGALCVRVTRHARMLDVTAPKQF